MGAKIIIHGVNSPHFRRRVPGSQMNQHQPSPPDTTNGPRPRRRGCTVLVIDDHRDTLEMVSRLLARHGYTVLSCDSCASARAAAEDALAAGTTVDLIIGDIGLPDGDGIELMCALKIRLGCPAAALTGHGMPDVMRGCINAGIDRHLLKPVGVNQLDEIIRDLAGC
jgi:CheY-like chemotaxis protein